MAKWKTKANNKKSMRERSKSEDLARYGKGIRSFGKLPSGDKRIALDNAVDRFIREGSCRHKQSLESPCVSFDDDLKGVCKRDGRICEL